MFEFDSTESRFSAAEFNIKRRLTNKDKFHMVAFFRSKSEVDFFFSLK